MTCVSCIHSINMYKFCSIFFFGLNQQCLQSLEPQNAINFTLTNFIFICVLVIFITDTSLISLLM